MDELLLTTLESEIREEYHIPPYFENLQNLIKEANAWFNQLENNIDYDLDLVARSLLKSRVFYAYNNKKNDFAIDYAYDVLTWQFSKIKGVL